ncbi:MAG: hypothetical protein AAFY24_18120 [Pseudomonadota bacterium]
MFLAEGVESPRAVPVVEADDLVIFRPIRENVRFFGTPNKVPVAVLFGRAQEKQSLPQAHA